MSFDGIVTGAVARQLNRRLLGARIEKIYQPESDEIVLHCHLGREKYKLYLSSNSAHCRVHLTETTYSNPPSPSAFCMLLRKHLQGGRIAGIEQKDSDRILEISVDTVNELGFSVNKMLIAEIMGKHSNIVLIDFHTKKIIDSIKRVSIDINRHRQLLPGLPYVYPPSQEKRNAYSLTKEDFLEALKQKNPLTPRDLVNTVCGVSPTFAEEVCFRAQKEKDAPLTASQVWPVFSQMMEQILSEQGPAAVYADSRRGPVEFHALPLLSYVGSQQYLFKDISSACDYYYSHKASSNRVRQKAYELAKAVDAMLQKLYLKKKRLAEDLLEAEHSERYRLFGELLTANLHKIQPGMSQVTVQNYYDNTPLTIPLEQKLSPSRNSQRYFKLYAKAKTAVKEKQIQLDETQQDLDYLESISTFLQQAETCEAAEAIRQELTELGYLKKRKQSGKPVRMKMKPFSYTTSDGFCVFAGHNNKENDYITFQLADKRDLWLHTKDIPGSHVILHTQGQKATETALREAASIAAFHSKGRESENVPVDYVPLRHVKKPNGAKPGMVIFTNNRTLYVNPCLPQTEEEKSDK